MDCEHPVTPVSSALLFYSTKKTISNKIKDQLKYKR